MNAGDLMTQEKYDSAIVSMASVPEAGLNCFTEYDGNFHEKMTLMKVSGYSLLSIPVTNRVAVVYCLMILIDWRPLTIAGSALTPY